MTKFMKKILKIIQFSKFEIVKKKFNFLQAKISEISQKSLQKCNKIIF